MAQTFAPSATYGNSNIKNRVKPGGDLGSNQYFYITNASTGKIDVYRHTENKVDGAVATVVVGDIPQGGKFTPNSNASSAEKTHYSSSREIGKVRSQALQVANREWNGKTQPPPSMAIYGTNAGNVGYTPPGSSTVDTSIKGIQNSGTASNIAKGAITGGINAALSGGNIAEGILGGALGSITGRRKNTSRGKVLVYPVTLRQTGNAQDYIKIQRMEWAPKKRTGYTWSNQRSSSAWGKSRQLDGSVILPIPGGISDSNAVSWGGDKMDPVQTAMANLALTGIEKGFGAMGDELTGLGKKIQNNDKNVKDAISKGIAGMASGTGAQLLTRTTGQILNPNMELLFKEPSLRPFNFTWKLAARSREEANVIIRIINFFKVGMAPQTAGEGLFLKSPMTWKLTYMHRGREHKYLNKFKECAMNSLTTQYTPDGNYATFETGHMVSYSITMGLTELDPVFSSDYGSNNEIGY